MGKTFTINGKKYTAKTFDFNLICDLEDMGIKVQDYQKKPMAMIRAYFALCFGGDSEIAGKEMQSHIIAGGNFDGISNAMAYEMEKSDFFQALNKRATEENPESEENLENEQK